MVSRAVELSSEHVAKGGIPFAALVLRADGQILASGVNRVVSDHDPLAHAEIVAMREAAARLKYFSLRGAILIASGEPCGLCYVATRYFGIGEVVFAAARQQAARFGFDYVNSYRMFADPPERWSDLRVRHLEVDDGLQPFELWRERQGTGVRP
jgi:tRNA(Arg) A34 adenosine deaminase TadA